MMTSLLSHSCRCSRPLLAALTKQNRQVPRLFTTRTKYERSRRNGIFYGLLSGAGLLTAGVLLKNANSENANLTENLCEILPEKKFESKQLLDDDLIEKSRRSILLLREELALPAVVIAVSVDGELVWKEGFGYSDVENLTKCRSDTAMRIASISKPIAMAIAARLIDQGKLDLDLPVQKYVPKFPVKTVNGEKVTLTTRQLVSQLGGIRHYEKGCTKDSISDGDMEEFYLKDEYKNVTECLDIFMKDDLEHKPGTKYLYTTHGWTLISAVIEGASGESFEKLTQDFFNDLGMRKSYLGYHRKIIPNQARYYVRNDKGRLENARLVDLSCKWAGGGMVSTVADLCTFGNTLLQCYQSKSTNSYIKQKTMQEMWTVQEPSRGKVKWVQNGGYGQGWGVDDGNYDLKNGCPKQFYVSHTGGACGASSVLTIIPSDENSDFDTNEPRGVVVAMVTNLQSVGLAKLALAIGRDFSAPVNE